MKVNQLIEPDTEKSFQLKLAIRQLKKMGYEHAFINMTSPGNGIPVDVVVPSLGTGHSPMSVTIRFIDDEHPWQVSWYKQGAHQHNVWFSDFADVLDEIKSLKP
jgi:hypothetical protein